MYQKDFILRMIEMLGELIAGILGLIRKGKFEQASQALENAYYDFLKEDAAFFRSITKEKLTGELIQEHNYTNGHLEILAGLFYTDAELLFAQGKYDLCVDVYEKSLLLYEFVEKASKTLNLGVDSRSSVIKNRIAQLKENGI